MAIDCAVGVNGANITQGARVYLHKGMVIYIQSAAAGAQVQEIKVYLGAVIDRQVVAAVPANAKIGEVHGAHDVLQGYRPGNILNG